MNRLSVATIALLTTCHTGFAMADNLPRGIYLGLSAGGAGIETRPTNLSTENTDAHVGGTGKLSVGYWFSRHWGIEGSYVPGQKFEQTFNAGVFRGKTDSYALSLLGRLPVNDRWSVVGKVSLTRNHTRDNGSTNGAANFDQFRGTDYNLVLPGLEVNYQFNDSTTLLFEVDPRGDAGDSTNIGYAGFGVRFVF
jgi:hypothetical protein